MRMSETLFKTIRMQNSCGAKKSIRMLVLLLMLSLESKSYEKKKRQNFLFFWIILNKFYFSTFFVAFFRFSMN